MCGVTFLLLGAAVATAPAGAEVRLAPQFSSHMVLERDRPIILWGTAQPRERLTLRFRKSSVRTRADMTGHWRARLPAQSAGGPDSLTIWGTSKVVLEDVLVGDVWLASGQSNMEFALKAARGGAAAVDAARDPAIRLLRIEHAVSARPTDGVETHGWAVASPSTVGDFSAIAYLFARELRRHVSVPIGLIESAWGGTYIESWMSAKALEPFHEYSDRLRVLGSITRSDEIEYRRYAQDKQSWLAAHRTEDRGVARGHPLWADPTFDASRWPRLHVPRPDSAWGHDFGGYDGTVWFRRELEVPEVCDGRDLELHLGVPFQKVEVYFDGRPAETLVSTQGTYRVSSEYVHRGRATITQRLTGADGYIMLSGRDESVFAACSTAHVALAGDWAYQTGADLAGFPAPAEPVKLADFYGFPGITVLSNAMIRPLAPTPIKGVIWYQGESNVGAAALYRRLLPAMIRDWRAMWQDTWPFLLVQLPGYSHDPAEPDSSEWASLRESQQAALALPNTGMATTVDLGDPEDVHPRNKKEVAERLARVARRIAYGETLEDSGPAFSSLALEGTRARVHFSHARGGLRVHDRYGYVTGFAVAARGGRFVWAQARIEGEDTVVWSDAVSEPTAVRYDWADTPDGDLYNEDGLPAVPFRTDATEAVPQP